jgi:hypothetical protein
MVDTLSAGVAVALSRDGEGEAPIVDEWLELDCEESG